MRKSKVEICLKKFQNENFKFSLKFIHEEFEEIKNTTEKNLNILKMQ